MNTIKRNIIFVLLALMSAVQAVAQDVTIVHLKDGSILRFPNGMFYQTMVSFLENTPEEVAKLIKYVRVEPETYRDNGEYAILLKVATNSSFRGRTIPSLCISTHPQPTLVNCDMVVELEKNYSDYYVLLGAVTLLNNQRWDNIRNRENASIVDFPLQKGQTYYCRYAMRIPYQQGGQQHEITAYASEDFEFRVPLLMADSGLLPEELCAADVTYPSASAWQTFCQQHFPQATEAVPDFLTRSWMTWIADHKQEFTDTEDHVFDDGVLHLVSAIPETFYEWLITREIVLNRPDQVTIIEKGSLYQLVTDVDASWGVPGNSYMEFHPETATSNTVVTFDLSELLPDMNYTVEVTFAPETLVENTEENARVFQTTKLRVYSLLGNDLTRLGESQYEIPATEVTRLTFDDISNITGLSVQVSVLARESTRFSRILRIAEIRLKPASN